MEPENRSVSGKKLTIYRLEELHLDFRELEVILVSGGTLNPCGHVLASVSSGGGKAYLHVAGIDFGQEHLGLKDPPRYFPNESAYLAYLRETKKTELRRIRFPIEHSKQAQVRLVLEKLVQSETEYRLFVDNCLTFVTALLAAGGHAIPNEVDMHVPVFKTLHFVSEIARLIDPNFPRLGSFPINIECPVTDLRQAHP